MTESKKKINAKNPHIYTIGLSSLMVLIGGFQKQFPYKLWGQEFYANGAIIYGLALVSVFVLIPIGIGLYKRFKKI